MLIPRSSVLQVLSSASILVLAAEPARAQNDPTWYLHGGQAGAHFGSSLATADVNGDGFGDLVVGAPDYDHDVHDEGRVTVYLGSSGGLSSLPNWSAHGLQPGAHFGARVAAAGDVNGDGFDDVLVTAPDFDRRRSLTKAVRTGPLGREHFTTDEGAIFVFHGSPTGLSLNSQRTATGIERSEHFGSAISGVGDVNGDGFADVVVGATGKADGRGGLLLFQGTPSGLAALPSWIQVGAAVGSGFGSLIAAAGDTDGDGFADFVAGRPGAPGCKQVVSFRGSAAGPILQGLVNEGVLALGPAGDFDGDGLIEQLFAANACNNSALRWRRLADGTSGTIPSLGALAAIATGDLNGDGRPDIAASAPGYGFGDFHGRVCVYLSAPGTALQAQAFPVFDGDQQGADFGAALACADVDGDGSAELFIAAPRQEVTASGEGAVSLIAGWSNGFEVAEVPPTIGSQIDDSQQSGIGDFDGDGRSDLVAMSHGSFEVRYGSPTGLPATADATLVPPPLEQSFPLVDFSTGDLNGDGFDDVQISFLPQFPFFTYDTRHSIYFGSSTGLDFHPAFTWLGSGEMGTGREAEIVGEVNADGYDDLLIGNALFFGTSGLPVHAQNLQGPDVYAALDATPRSGRHRGVLSGDLDGDPYADVIVARRSNLVLQLDVLRGSPTGLVRQQLLQPQSVIELDDMLAFGRAKVLAMADLDGDGLDDLVLEYPNESGTISELAFFHGSAAGLERRYPWWDYTFTPDFRWRQPLLHVLDADQDGFQDLLIGGSRLHRGSPAGLRRVPTWVGSPDLSEGALSTTGDFDGDGRPEFTDWNFFLRRLFECVP